MRSAEIQRTINSAGWRILNTDIAEQILRKMEKEALSCDDPAKIVDLQRVARGARQFHEAYLTAAQHAAAATTDTGDAWQ